MTIQPIEDLKPFSELGDLRTLMATLAEPALRAQIAAQSQVMSEPWMQMIAEGGLLRLPHACRTPHEDRDAFHDGVDQWTRRLVDFTRFTNQSSWGVMTDASGREIEYLAHGGTQGVQDVFASATADVLSDYQTLLSHPLVTESNSSTSALRALSHWMAGAIALDLPDAVATMAKSVPEVAGSTLKIQSLHPELAEYLLHQATANGHKLEGDLSASLTPQGVALMLSREACLDALWIQGVSPLAKLGDHTTTNGVYNGNKGPDVHTVPFFTDTVTSVMVPCFTPQAWEKAMTKMLSDPAMDHERKRDLFCSSQEELLSVERPWVKIYLGALVNSKAFHWDVNSAMCTACRSGSVEVLDALLPDVQWKAPGLENAFSNFESPLVRATRHELYGDDDHREECVLKVMAAASAAGRSDLVMNKLDSVREQESIEPLFSFVKGGFKTAVLKSIEDGWDPKTNPPGFGEAPTLLDYADRASPDMAHTIRTYLARAKALSALGDMETPIPKQTAAR